MIAVLLFLACASAKEDSGLVAFACDDYATSCDETARKCWAVTDARAYMADATACAPTSDGAACVPATQSSYTEVGTTYLCALCPATYTTLTVSICEPAA